MANTLTVTERLVMTTRAQSLVHSLIMCPPNVSTFCFTMRFALGSKQDVVMTHGS